jgi:hypothetical protein
MHRILVLLAICGLIFACGNDRYAAPGSEGTLPDGLIIEDPGMEISVAKGGVATLNCSPPPYKITVLVKQLRANCTGGFNFTPLYNRAKALLDKRIGELQCPVAATPRCDNKIPVIALEKWVCESDFDRAVLRLQGHIYCLGPTAPVPTGLAAPTPAQLTTSPFEAPAGTPNIDAALDGADEIIREKATPPAGCPGRHQYLFSYSEEIPPGTAITDYEPYVQRAKDRAEKYYYDMLSCAGSCRKEIYTVVYHEWSRVGNSVLIRIAFSFQCNQ